METKNKIWPNHFLFSKIAMALIQKRGMLLSLMLVLFSSCETVTEIDFPEEKPQLVINAIFNADSLVKVDLTESQPVNNRSLNFKIVENASIEIFKNATSIGFLQYKGKGKYLSESKLPYETNAGYTLKVKTVGFETAESSEIIPVKPLLSSLEVKPDQNNNSFYKTFKAKFKLQDSNQSNFYFIRVWLINNRGFRSNPVGFSLSNSFGQFLPAAVSGSEMVVFTDETFNGKEIVFDMGIGQVYTGNLDGQKIQIELGSTTKNYYDYQFSLRKQLQGDPILNSSGFPVSNNIKNGLGIFAPYNSATVDFDVVR